MAVDQTTVYPIKPFMGEGGTTKTGSPTATVHATDATTYAVGDILILTSGRAVVDNTNPTVANILGVCAEDYTAPATVGSNDKVRYWPNVPGRIWEGSFTDDATDADVTPTIAATVGADFGIDSSSITAGFPVIDSGTPATSTALVIDIPPYQIRGEAFVDGATTNPRVLFVFVDGLLH